MSMTQWICLLNDLLLKLMTRDPSLLRRQLFVAYANPTFLAGLVGVQLVRIYCYQGFTIREISNAVL